MAGRLTRVAIKNYKSIASCDVELQPLTLLVGPNGSGKSNFLDALRFLVQSIHSPLEEVVAIRQGIRSLLHRNASHTATHFSIEVDAILDGGLPGRYVLSIGPEAKIVEELCEIGPDRFHYKEGSLTHTSPVTPASTAERPYLAAFGGTPPFSAMYNFIAGFSWYKPNPEVMRQPRATGTGSVLSRDAANAANVLANLEQNAPDDKLRLAGYLSSFTPDLSDVSVVTVANTRWLSFKSRFGGFEGAEVSDGTLRALGVLLAIFQTPKVTEKLTVVGLEEPEINLHPAAAGVLLDALEEGSDRVSIIATTHSADLLDRKGLPVECLLAVAMVDGRTVIGPVDEAGRSIVRKRLFTAGELMRSNELRPDSGVRQ